MFSLLSIIEHAGPIGLFIMSLLLVFSIISWAIIMAKWQYLRGIIKANADFIQQFWQTKDLYSLLGMTINNSPSALMFRDALSEWERQKQRSAEKASSLLIIERAISRSGRSEIKRAESMLTILATIGSISPFIGLLGTVIGIMSSFQKIGQAGNASLNVVAPGIAEALLATALGLFAAIPAVMAYNSFQTQLRNLRNDLENFALDMLAVLKSLT